MAVVPHGTVAQEHAVFGTHACLPFPSSCCAPHPHRSPRLRRRRGRQFNGAPSPARGEGVEGPGRRGENRALSGPAVAKRY
jgi:hypothetical protein